MEDPLGTIRFLPLLLLLLPIFSYLMFSSVTRLVSDVPPAHYTFKINSFSELSKILSKTGLKKYESGNFEIGSYEWTLSLYPDGDKKRGGRGHISLYLVLAKTNSLPLGLEVNASFKFFVYDQIRDKYLTIEYENRKERRFRAIKNEWGVPKLLPLTSFNNAANGYLINDCCIFGVEVFVRSCTGKGESFSVIRHPQAGRFSWKRFYCWRPQMVLTPLGHRGKFFIICIKIKRFHGSSRAKDICGIYTPCKESSWWQSQGEKRCTLVQCHGFGFELHGSKQCHGQKERVHGEGYRYCRSRDYPYVCCQEFLVKMMWSLLFCFWANLFNFSVK